MQLFTLKYLRPLLPIVFVLGFFFVFLFVSVPKSEAAVSVTWNTWQASITNTASSSATVWVWVQCYDTYQPNCPLQYQGTNTQYSVVIAPGQTITQGPALPFCFEGQMDIGTLPGGSDIASQSFTAASTPAAGGINGICNANPCSPPPPSADANGMITVTIQPTADAYVTSDFPNTNFASASPLQVMDLPRKYAYLQFNLNPFANVKVLSAKMRLLSTTTHTAIIRIQDVHSSWQENTVTYNTRPASDTTYAIIDSGFLNAWMEADVTSPVAARNGGNISFRAMTYDVDQDVQFASREACADAPQLVVTYDPSSIFVPPAPTPTPDVFTPNACSVAAGDVMIVLDVSSSLTTLDKNQSKAAAKAFVDQMGENTANRIGLIMFGNNKTSKVLSPFTSNFNAVKTAIDNIPDTLSGSCLECASYMANQEFKNTSRTGVKRAIVFLSDGNVHGSLLGGYTNNAQLEEQLTTEEVQRGYQASGTTYYTVGEGNHVGKPFFPQLATMTGGKYYDAKDATDLTAIYNDIAVTIGIGNGSISGTIYEDKNYNKKLDGSDTPLSGWTVNIIGSGISGTKTTTSKSDGTYSFGGLCNGDFRVFETVNQGYIQWDPPSPFYRPLKLTTGNSFTAQDFGNVLGYTVKGNVFDDINKNRIKDNGEDNYSGPITITASDGTVTTTNNGTYTITGLLAGTYTVSYYSLPKGYIMIYPLNGPPPTFVFTVGPGCIVNGVTNGSCDGNNNIVNLNFSISNAIPWVQGVGMDMRFDNGYDNYIAAAPACGVGSYGSAPGSGSTPGIIFTGSSQPNFGVGQSSPAGWVVGGTAYPDTFTTTKTELSTSYNTLLATLQKGGQTITDIQTLPSCSDLSNCTLPPALSASVLHANGDLTLNTYTFPANKNVIILVKGTLTINGNIIVPGGSVALFSARGNIIINKNVGTAPTCTVGNNVVQGIYSANGNVTVDGYNDCVAHGEDNMLHIDGAVIVNAGIQGGKFINNRDLCGSDLQYPTVTFSERPDFILNMPDIVRQKSFVYQEVAP